jgi:hypothetical protein
MLVQYLHSIFSVFFRWWWAVLTGVFTILTPIFLPSGVSVGPKGLAVTIFIFLTLAFIALSTTVASWNWFASAECKPTLTELVPAQPKTKTPLTFIVRPEVIPLSPGNLLAVFRQLDHGVEVCAAILEVKSKRTNGTDWQAEAKWISALHQTALQANQVQRSNLRLKVIDGEAVALVEKCTREAV